jgi:hypothetical protein
MTQRREQRTSTVEGLLYGGTGNTAAVRRAARLVIADHAETDELRLLLTVLALWPEDD